MRNLLSCLALGAMLTTASGCTLIQWLTVVFFPQEEAAVHDFTDSKTLIWFEVKGPTDFRMHRLSDLSATYLKAGNEELELLTHEALSELPHDISLEGKTIAQVGQLVEADQVLYVRLLSEKMDTGHGYHGGEVKGHLRVIDVKSGRRLFPVGASHSGYPLTVKMPVENANFTSASMQNELRDSLEMKISRQIAHLFLNTIPKPMNRDQDRFGNRNRGGV